MVSRHIQCIPGNKLNPTGRLGASVVLEAIQSRIHNLFQDYNIGNLLLTGEYSYNTHNMSITLTLPKISMVQSNREPYMTSSKGSSF